MKWNAPLFRRRISIVILATALITWGYLFLWPNDRPEMMQMLAGCYYNAAGANARIVKISRNGELSYGTMRTKISIQYGKESYLILPKQKVYVSPVEAGTITFDHDEPLFLEVGHDKRSFYVPNENGPAMLFVKTVC